MDKYWTLALVWLIGSILNIFVGAATVDIAYMLMSFTSALGWGILTVVLYHVENTGEE